MGGGVRTGTDLDAANKFNNETGQSGAPIWWKSLQVKSLNQCKVKQVHLHFRSK